MKYEYFLEDLNNLLKSGEILSLFSQDEIKEICEKMLAIDKQRDKSLQTDGSAIALYNFFVSVSVQGTFSAAFIVHVIAFPLKSGHSGTTAHHCVYVPSGRSISELYTKISVFHKCMHTGLDPSVA